MITIRGEAAGPGWVRLYREDGETRENWNSVSVDKFGAYETEPMPAGEVTLEATVSAPGQTRLRQEVRITVGAADTVRNVDFPGAGSVSGAVSGLLAGEHAMVVAMPGNVTLPDGPGVTPSELFGKDCVAQANVEDGAYRLEGLAPGDYTVRAIPSGPASNDTAGYRVAADTIRIEGEESVTRDLRIERHP
ncbi:MAG: hypothetical protein HZB26_04555 [Candidatus Hydrogenedentes bacterium]|nr:hypothetical protein [Candidatus Hydrogenedentota bacterium]